MTPSPPYFSLCAPLLCALLVAASLGGCPKPALIEPSAEPELTRQNTPALSAVRVAARRELSGLQAVACGVERCILADAEQLVPFDPVTLEPVGIPAVHGMLAVSRIVPRDGELLVEGSCELGPCSLTYQGDGSIQATFPIVGDGPNPMEAILAPEEPPAPPAAENPALAERAHWAGLMDAGRRLPFQRRVPVVGGMVTYQRELGGGSGKLARIGGGFRSIDAPGTPHTVSCEGWLATHPSGLEVYLLLWPEAKLRSYDARTMSPHWSVELPGPAQGLFVDPAGRFTLLSLTGPPDEDRLTDYPPPPLIADASGDLLAGAAALPDDRPTALGVLLVDLAARHIAVQASGAFRGWLTTPDGAHLLVTESELLRLEPR